MAKLNLEKLALEARKKILEITSSNGNSLANDLLENEDANMALACVTMRDNVSQIIKRMCPHCKNEFSTKVDNDSPSVSICPCCGKKINPINTLFAERPTKEKKGSNNRYSSFHSSTLWLCDSFEFESETYGVIFDAAFYCLNNNLTASFDCFLQEKSLQNSFFVFKKNFKKRFYFESKEVGSVKTLTTRLNFLHYGSLFISSNALNYVNELRKNDISISSKFPNDIATQFCSYLRSSIGVVALIDSISLAPARTAKKPTIDFASEFEEIKKFHVFEIGNSKCKALEHTYEMLSSDGFTGKTSYKIHCPETNRDGIVEDDSNYGLNTICPCCSTKIHAYPYNFSKYGRTNYSCEFFSNDSSIFFAVYKIESTTIDAYFDNNEKKLVQLVEISKNKERLFDIDIANGKYVATGGSAKIPLRKLYSVRSVNNALKFSSDNLLKFSGIKELFSLKYSFHPSLFVKYAKMYFKHPVLEKVVKEGFDCVVTSALNANAFNNMNLDATTTAEFFGCSKTFLDVFKKFSKKNNGENSQIILSNILPYVELYQANEKTENNIPITTENLEYAEENHINFSSLVENMSLSKMPLAKVLKYLERVRVYQCIEPNVALRLWNDYLTAAKLIGVNLEDKRARCPQSLKKEHDITLYKSTIINNIKTSEEFETLVQEIGEDLKYSNRRFSIIYPKDLKELFEEGRVLNHCVGIYGDRILDKNHFIMFARWHDTPDQPYYTIDINPQTRELIEVGTTMSRPLTLEDNPALFDFVKRWMKSKDIKDPNKILKAR